MMDLQKGAADKHTIHFSAGAIYILRLGEGGLGKGAERCLSMSFPKCPLLAKAGLLIVGGQTSPRLSCRQGSRLGDKDVSPTTASSFLWRLWWFAEPYQRQHPHLGYGVEASAWPFHGHSEPAREGGRLGKLHRSLKYC